MPNDGLELQAPASRPRAVRIVSYLVAAITVGVPLAHSSLFLHSYMTPKEVTKIDNRADACYPG
jgi:hypothetical protein